MAQLKQLRINVTNSEHVELMHAFRQRGASALKNKVARVLRAIDADAGRSPSLHDWYHPAHEAEGYAGYTFNLRRG